MRIHFSSPVRPKMVAKKLKASLCFLGTTVGLSRAKELAAHLYGYQSWHELDASIGVRQRSLDDEQLDASQVAARREYQITRLCDSGVPVKHAEYAVKMICPTAEACAPFTSFEDGRVLFAELSRLVGAEAFRFYTRGEGLGTLALLIDGRWVEDPVRRVENAHQINQVYPWSAGISGWGPNFPG